MASLCPSNETLLEGDPVVFFARAHFNPQTGTMLSDEQLLPWRLLRFRLTDADVDEGADGDAARRAQAFVAFMVAVLIIFREV